MWSNKPNFFNTVLFTTALAVLLTFSIPVLAASHDTPVEITMWTWFTEFRGVFPEIIEDFNETHEDIKVKNQFIGLSEYLQKLQSAVSGKNEPDIFGTHVNAKSYGEEGITIDLKEWVDEDFLDRFFEGTIKQYTFNDRLTALPWTAQTFGIFYNTKIFKEQGLETPNTWDELIDVSNKLRENGVKPIAFGNRGKWLGTDFFLPLITQVTNDPELVLRLDREWSDSIGWDSEPVVEAYELLDKLVENDVFVEGLNGISNEQARIMFYNGQAAMFIQGSWEPGTAAQQAPEDFSYDVFQMPALSSNQSHWTGNESGAQLTVSARSEHKPEAIEFLKYLYRSDVYAKAMIEGKGMPAMPETIPELEDPIIKKMTGWLSNGAPHILYGAGSWDAVANATQGLMGGNLTPKEAASQIEEAVERARER